MPTACRCNGFYKTHRGNKNKPYVLLLRKKLLSHLARHLHKGLLTLHKVFCQKLPEAMGAPGEETCSLLPVSASKRAPRLCLQQALRYSSARHSPKIPAVKSMKSFLLLPPPAEVKDHESPQEHLPGRKFLPQELSFSSVTFIYRIQLNQHQFSAFSAP